MKYFLFLIVLSLGISCLSNPSKKVLEPPQPNEVQRDSVWIETSNGTVFGILFKPKGSQEKLPAVLCLQGGGDVGLNNYLYEAKFFAENGLVALVCDKSGTGLSSTKKRWTQQSFNDKAKEYHELFTWLANLNYTDPNKVGVHGMSEGGRLALKMAIDHPDKIAFINSVSGPIESYKLNQLYAIGNYLKARGTHTTTIEKVLNLWNDYFDEIALGKISQETVAQITEIRRLNPEIQYLPANSTELPSRPLQQDIHFTLEGELGTINCPVLFQFGAQDILVNPVRSISLIPENSQFEIKKYPSTDHSMNLQNGDIEPRYMDDKKEWIVSVLKQL